MSNCVRLFPPMKMQGVVGVTIKLRERPPRVAYMGSGGVFDQYAPAYLDERMWQIEKDMAICLSGRPAQNGKGFDHAYFPALTACCGMLELLANLHGGSTERCGLIIGPTHPGDIH